MVPSKDASMSECFEQEFETKREIKSPFSRQLVVDFYDGTVAALVQCGMCGRTYSCFMVDSNKKLTKRIFTLRPVDADALAQLLALDAAVGKEPTWPYWVPQIPAEIGHTLFPKSMEILNSAAAPEWLIAANPYIDTIFAVKRVSKELIGDVNASIERKGKVDWMAFLGVPRDES